MESVTRKLFAVVAILAAVACSAAGTGGRIGGPAGMLPAAKALAVPSQRHHRKKVHAYARIIVPRRYPHRHGHFISSATRGIQIVAKSSGFTETTVAALGPGAPGCKSYSSGVACLVVATVWEGANTIGVTTYDTAPVSGAIPSGAKILGIASVTENVSPSSNSLTIFLGGKIGKIGGSPAFSTVAADGVTHDVAIVLDPKDFGNQPITAGSYDPFANPIKATLNETGGSGHAQLVIAGRPTGSSGKIKYSSDTLAVRYDGNGKAGYAITVKLAASGAPSETLQISPLIVEGTPVYQHVLGLNGTSSTPTLTITEANAPSGQTYAVTPSGCSGIATAGSVSGSGSSATFSVNGGATASASGCSISIGDTLYSTTLVLPVTNTPFAGGVSVSGVNIQEYGPLPSSPGPLTVGPDGNLWFVEGGNGGGQLTAYRPTATGPTVAVAPFSVGTSSLYGINAGPDGNLWVADQSNLGLDRVTTSGAVTVFAGTITDCPVGIVNANDGTMWATNNCGSPYFYNVTIGGATTNFSPAGASQPAQIVVGKDGAFYAADGTNIDRWNGTTLTQIPEPNGESIASVTSVPTDGATGAIWYTSNLVSTTTTSYVGRLAIGAASAAEVATYNNVNNGGQLNGIVAAPNGTVWFTDSLNVRIGRCKVAAQTCVEFPSTGTLPHTDPQNIVVGPDGSLWFTDLGGFLGHILP